MTAFAKAPGLFKPQEENSDRASFTLAGRMNTWVNLSRELYFNYITYMSESDKMKCLIQMCLTPKQSYSPLNVKIKLAVRRNKK